MNIAVSRQLISLYRFWLCAVLSVDAFICGILSVYSFYICLAIMAVSTLSAAFIAFSEGGKGDSLVLSLI